MLLGTFRNHTFDFIGVAFLLNLVPYLWYAGIIEPNRSHNAEGLIAVDLYNGGRAQHCRDGFLSGRYFVNKDSSAYGGNGQGGQE